MDAGLIYYLLCVFLCIIGRIIYEVNYYRRTGENDISVLWYIGSLTPFALLVVTFFLLAIPLFFLFELEDKINNRN